MKAPFFRGDIDMRIARDGTWFYKGTPIERKALVKLFSTILSRDEAGDYWLKTPVEETRIQVEDAPFVAVELKAEGEGREQKLSFRSNLDEWVEAGERHPIRVERDPQSGEPSPYVAIRPGLDALIARPVYYELAGLAVPDPEQPQRLGVWSKGRFFVLGEAAT
jgi:hypothetical protein